MPIKVQWYLNDKRLLLYCCLTNVLKLGDLNPHASPESRTSLFGCKVAFSCSSELQQPHLRGMFEGCRTILFLPWSVDDNV